MCVRECLCVRVCAWPCMHARTCVCVFVRGWVLVCVLVYVRTNAFVQAATLAHALNSNVVTRGNHTGDQPWPLGPKAGRQNLCNPCLVESPKVTVRSVGYL